jgi:hypothetical protein
MEGRSGEIKMIISKAVWIAVTLMCQVSYKTKDTQKCILNFSEISKTQCECEKKKLQSEKCIQFKSGEYLVMYDTFKKGELK